MSNSESQASNFLKDAFASYAQYSAAQKQEMQKAALKWLQQHINNDLEDKTILEQFSKKWRYSSKQPLSDDPIDFTRLPSSYKGEKSVSGHQEEALAFLQAAVPQKMQDDFQQRWELQAKLEVSNSTGATFKIDQRDMALLQQADSDGDGTAWYQVEDKSLYYLLSYAEKGDDYWVELSEEISSKNQNTWFVAQEQVKISSI